MRYPSMPSARLLPRLLPLLAGAALAAPVAAHGQSAGDLVKAAHDRQRDFEMFRQSRIPVDHDQRTGGCDAQIGRICIWFGGDEETDFPPEAPEVDMARRQLINVLQTAAAQVNDPWVMGQLVHYLDERGSYSRAETVARACGLKEPWWCSALLGYTLHLRGDWIGAQAAFEEAVAGMPQKEREKWAAPRYIFSRDDEKKFEKQDDAEQARQWALFWRLSDPLYLVPGNDRLTEHFARWVQAANEKDAENPQGMFWDEDLEETLVRYGRLIGYSRNQTFPQAMRGGRVNLQDTRQVIGHHNPRSRGYLFPEEFLRSPSDIPPESWITAPREARTWYAPPYAPDFQALESQVGRFRRGDEMLVVGAYRPATPLPEGVEATNEPMAGTPTESVDGPVKSALFLVPLDGGDLSEVDGTDAHGVFTLRAPPGKYVSSIEVLDSAGRRAWRARQGVRQDPLIPGLVAVSDLLILNPDAQLPATLDEAIPDVRPDVRIHQGERFTVVWEVYGLKVDQPANVTLGFTKGRPGFLARVGDFLGLLEPDQPVEVQFQDTGSDQAQTLFRSVGLQLPDLEPGEYTLHLKLELQGREPAITSRPIIVVP